MRLLKFFIVALTLSSSSAFAADIKSATGTAVPLPRLENLLLNKINERSTAQVDSLKLTSVRVNKLLNAAIYIVDSTVKVYSVDISLLKGSSEFKFECALSYKSLHKMDMALALSNCEGETGSIADIIVHSEELSTIVDRAPEF